MIVGEVVVPADSTLFLSVNESFFSPPISMSSAPLLYTVTIRESVLHASSPLFLARAVLCAETWRCRNAPLPPQTVPSVPSSAAQSWIFPCPLPHLGIRVPAVPPGVLPLRHSGTLSDRAGSHRRLQHRFPAERALLSRQSDSGDSCVGALSYSGAWDAVPYRKRYAPVGNAFPFAAFFSYTDALYPTPQSPMGQFDVLWVLFVRMAVLRRLARSAASP